MHHNPASYHQVVLHDTARGCWLHFEHPREIIETSRVEDVLDSLGYVKKAIAERGLYAAGLVAYEAAPAFDPALTVKRDEEFPLVWFGLYDKPRETEILTSCTKPSSIQKFRWFPSVTSHEYRKGNSGNVARNAARETGHRPRLGRQPAPAGVVAASAEKDRDGDAHDHRLHLRGRDLRQADLDPLVLGDGPFQHPGGSEPRPHLRDRPAGT